MPKPEEIRILKSHALLEEGPQGRNKGSTQRDYCGISFAELMTPGLSTSMTFVFCKKTKLVAPSDSQKPSGLLPA